MRRLVLLLFITTVTALAQTEDPRLAKFLERFPEADQNGDGILTMEEAMAYRREKQKADRPAGNRRAEPQAPGKRYAEGELAELFEAREFEGMPYRFFAPKVEEGKTYPLVLSLHGAGGKGSDNRKNLKPWLGPLTEPEFQERHPCFIVAPQSPEAWRIPGSEPEVTPELTATFPGIWQEILEKRGGFITPVTDGKLGTALALLDQLGGELPIDPDRVYVLGHSMGGFGSFEAIATDPDRFAAAIPSAGGLAPWHDPKTFANVPVWAFHGSEDGTVVPGLTRSVFDRMKEVGGNMKFTTLGGIGHGAASWAFVYEGDGMNENFSTAMSSEKCDPTEDVWEWLFSKRRGDR